MPTPPLENLPPLHLANLLINTRNQHGLAALKAKGYGDVISPPGNSARVPSLSPLLEGF